MYLLTFSERKDRTQDTVNQGLSFEAMNITKPLTKEKYLNSSYAVHKHKAVTYRRQYQAYKNCFLLALPT